MQMIPTLPSPLSLSSSLTLTLLRLLPFLTLILALPAPVSSLSPIQGEGAGTDTHLTPSTFASSTAHGLWFVEHYSPWCGHCKHFRPTWEKLVEQAGRGVWEEEGGGGKGGSGDVKGEGKGGEEEESGEDLKEVRMGSVDCSVHGDLCDANNIKGYPTLVMFHDGQAIDTFKGARELEELKRFLSRHVRAVRRVVKEKEEEEATLKEKEKAKAKEEEEKEKAKVDKEKEKEKEKTFKANNDNTNTNTNTNSQPNPSGQVLSLTGSTFDIALSPSSSPPTFVKFFAPWCGHCKKLAPTWRLLAKHMQGKVVIAEVDCDERGNKKLCEREGVEGYPTLVWYPGGGGKGEGQGKRGMVYEQGRKLDQLKAFAEKASSAGVHPISDAQELDKHIAEEDIVYLLLHSEGDEQIVNQIRSAASPLLGSPPILSSSSPALLARYSLTPLPSLSSSSSHKPWAILALKDGDHVFPSAAFIGQSFTYPDPDADSEEEEEKKMEEAREWMMTHRLPTAVELTRDTFQSVMNAPQKPLVVLALAASSSSAGSGSSESAGESDSGNGEVREKVMARLRELGSKWRMRNRKRLGLGKEGESGSGDKRGEEGVFEGREVVFAWMDDGKWADWVKSMYGVGVGSGRGSGSGVMEGVRVVLADHANLVYYDIDAAGNNIRFTSSVAIFTAVEDALKGRTPFKHSEGVVERLARYLNAKLRSVERSVVDRPFRSVLVLLGVLGGVFWVLTRFVGGSASRGDGYEREREEWREVKGRRGRLD